MSKDKSNILIIGINFSPESTGIGKYTGELAFYLGNIGNSVRVITGFPYYPHWKIFEGYSNWFYKTEIKGNVSITRCPIYVPESLSGSRRMLQDLSFFTTAFFCILRRIILRTHYDMVFIASPSFMSGFLGLFYKFFFNKTKLIYHIQDLQIDAAEELGLITNDSLLRMIKWSEKKILAKADWVTTISNGMKNKILNKLVLLKNIYIFPNWADYNHINFKSPNLKVISALGIPLNKRMVFYSGAIGEKQGIEIIFDIAAKSSLEMPDLFYVIAGSGPYSEILKTKVSQIRLCNILLIEIQPVEVFNELLNHAWLHLILQKSKVSDLLLPSKLTNILAVGGLALITALPNTSLYEIIKNNKIGVLIPPDDVNAFWKAIVDLYNKQGLFGVLKKNAMVYAEENLKMSSVIENFLNEISL